MAQRKTREINPAAALAEIEYPEDLQTVYDEISDEGKELFEISFDEDRDSSEFMTTAQIRAEIARRRGSITR